MKKYRSNKAESTRREILESATQLFCQHGINGVSLSRIMSEIGMTPGGFYKYFSSKEELAGEVCVRSFRQTREVWSAIIDHKRPGSESPLGSMISEYLKQAKDGRCPVVAFGHDVASAAHDDSFLEVYRDQTKVLVETLIDVAQQRGSARTREQLLVLFAAMLGVGLLVRAAGTEQWSREIEGALMLQWAEEQYPKPVE